MTSRASNRFNDGTGFEGTVIAICEAYEKARRVRAFKVSPPTVVVKGRVIMKKNPFLDFVGSWSERKGRMLMFECKSTSEPRLPFGSDGISERQLKLLAHWGASGAIAFVLWEYRGAVKLITEGVILAAEAGRQPDGKARKHLKWDIDGFEVPGGQGFVIHDFLRVMNVLWPN